SRRKSSVKTLTASYFRKFLQLDEKSGIFPIMPATGICYKGAHWNVEASLMTQLNIVKPADGSRVVYDPREAVLFGQPPEVLKGLLLQGIERIDTLVLIETCERDGSLLNNLEFPLYFFLFMGDGLAQGRKLNLVGQKDAISRALSLLRLTLNGT